MAAKICSIDTLPKPLPIISSPLTAQGRRRQRNRRARARSDLNEADTRCGIPPSLLRDTFEQALCRISPDVVQYHIEPVLDPFAAERGNHSFPSLTKAKSSASAPSCLSSFSTCGLRPAATTRLAPRRFATCTASWPATPGRHRFKSAFSGQQIARAKEQPVRTCLDSSWPRR